jgi:TrpR-related protein YerC/YecD
MQKWNNPKTDALVKALLSIENVAEGKKFLRDLMTEREIVEFGNRWKAARMLGEGNSYVRIEKKTGLSSTTIARVSKWLTNGMGGYKLVSNRLNHHSSSPPGKELR